MKLLASVVAVTAFLGRALAHGGVQSYVVNGVEYQGFTPYNPASGQQVVQWQWATYDPIYSASDSLNKCNKPGTGPAAKTIPIKAGDTITAKWKQWTHMEGPVLVYMARVNGNSFSSSDGNGKVWFKIAHTGLVSGTINKGVWGAGQVLTSMKYDAKIPASLAPGKYLIRHEVIAMHQAKAPQFYMQCAQLEVSGSGSAVPSGNYLASFPGTYNQNDPSINVDVYTATTASYSPPGPPVWTG